MKRAHRAYMRDIGAHVSLKRFVSYGLCPPAIVEVHGTTWLKRKRGSK